jgi:hypothetical protein
MPLLLLLLQVMTCMCTCRCCRSAAEAALQLNSKLEAAACTSHKLPRQIATTKSYTALWLNHGLLLLLLLVLYNAVRSSCCCGVLIWQITQQLQLPGVFQLPRLLLLLLLLSRCCALAFELPGYRLHLWKSLYPVTAAADPAAVP